MRVKTQLNGVSVTVMRFKDWAPNECTWRVRAMAITLPVEARGHRDCSALGQPRGPLPRTAAIVFSLALHGRLGVLGFHSPQVAQNRPAVQQVLHCRATKRGHGHG